MDKILSKLAALLGRIPLDKLMHFIAGHVVTFVVLVLALGAEETPLKAAAVAAIGLAVLAVGKEIYDSKHRDAHTPDVWDAVATVLGGAPLLLTVYIMETFK